MCRRSFSRKKEERTGSDVDIQYVPLNIDRLLRRLLSAHVLLDLGESYSGIIRIRRFISVSSRSTVPSARRVTVYCTLLVKSGCKICPTHSRAQTPAFVPLSSRASSESSSPPRARARDTTLGRGSPRVPFVRREGS